MCALERETGASQRNTTRHWTRAWAIAQEMINLSPANGGDSPDTKRALGYHHIAPNNCC